MKGPIEYYVDRRAELKGRPTFAQELADSDTHLATQAEKIGSLTAGMGGLVSATSVLIISQPGLIELNEPNSVLVRQSIETAITVGLDAPFAVTAVMGAAMFFEGLSIRKRARRHIRLLDLNVEDAE